MSSNRTSFRLSTRVKDDDKEEKEKEKDRDSLPNGGKRRKLGRMETVRKISMSLPYVNVQLCSYFQGGRENTARNDVDDNDDEYDDGDDEDDACGVVGCGKKSFLKNEVI